MTTNWPVDLLTLLLAGKSDTALALKSKFLPKSLYRYRTYTDINLLNLAGHKEWLSTPQNFNDIFDCCVTNIREEIYATLRKTFGNVEFEAPDQVDDFFNNAFHIDGIAALMTDSLNRNLRDKDVRIACFSERIDSAVMWAHYADQHTGYCVAYDFTKSNQIKHFFPVVYEPIPLSAITNATDECPASSQFPLLFKDKDWSYEREWRMIYYDLLAVNQDSQLLKMPVPTGVYLGCYADQSLKEAMVDIVKKENIPLYQMHADFYRRELQALRLF